MGGTLESSSLAACGMLNSASICETLMSRLAEVLRVSHMEGFTLELLQLVGTCRRNFKRTTLGMVLCRFVGQLRVPGEPRTAEIDSPHREPRLSEDFHQQGVPREASTSSGGPARVTNDEAPMARSFLPPFRGRVAYRVRGSHFVDSMKTRSLRGWKGACKSLPREDFVMAWVGTDEGSNRLSIRAPFRQDGRSGFCPKDSATPQMSVKHTSLLSSIRALRRSGARTSGAIAKDLS